ncbi:MAG: aminotransferase class III-fold pyridoxal phosphate-dependent enzyme, partial [Candidatus Nanopelagicales bacterium]
IEMEGPDTIAAVFMEPLQNTGGVFAPPDGYWDRVREDLRHVRHPPRERRGDLCVAWVGHVRLAEVRLPARHDHLRQGGHVGLRAPRRRDDQRPHRRGVHGRTTAFLQGQTFGAHPVSCAVANANLDIFEREDICGHVLANERTFRYSLQGLRDIPLVGDVRGEGYFHAIELVPDQATKGTFTDEQAEWLLRGLPVTVPVRSRPHLPRPSTAGEPVITLSPPLIAGPAEFEFIESTLRTVLTDASNAFAARSRSSAP